MSESNFSRRKFLASAATIGAVGAMGVSVLSSCSGPKKPASALNLPLNNAIRQIQNEQL